MIHGRPSPGRVPTPNLHTHPQFLSTKFNAQTSEDPTEARSSGTTPRRLGHGDLGPLTNSEPSLIPVIVRLLWPSRLRERTGRYLSTYLAQFLVIHRHNRPPRLGSRPSIVPTGGQLTATFFPRSGAEAIIISCGANLHDRVESLDPGSWGHQSQTMSDIHPMCW